MTWRLFVCSDCATDEGAVMVTWRVVEPADKVGVLISVNRTDEDFLSVLETIAKANGVVLERVPDDEADE